MTALGMVGPAARARAARCKLADNCVRCMHGVGHPPLVVLYDDSKSTYAIAEGDVCVARWASSGHTHGEGDLCGAEATMTVAGIDLCPHHADRLQNWQYFEYPEEHVREKTDRLREADQQYEAAVRESEVRREEVDAAVSLVYYIRRTSDGAVKIGTTRSFTQRMSALRVAFGELQTLLTESGTVKNEKLRHKQFAPYRIGRTEWFVPSKTLLAWIESRRGDYGMRRSQQPGVMPRADLHRLVVAAPADRVLKWRNGKVVWPPDAAVA